MNKIEPFDKRLLVGIKYSNDSSVNSQLPFSGKIDTIARSLFMTPETIESKRSELKKSGIPDSDIDSMIKAETELIAKHSKKIELATQPALINPYARIRLSGAINFDGTSKLIDKTGQRPWYEIDSNDAIGYSKIPTTARLIEFGKHDERGRTPYQFQDFVFCKWWNKIPNNRLITLRRYAAPILDNLNTPSDDGENDVMFPPLATAITYFGDDTSNSLKDILKFSTGLNWGDTSANVWDVQSTQEGAVASTNSVMKGAGSALGLEKLFGLSAHALNGLSILKNDINLAGLQESNGLPPDPYSNGPYENRIKGPVNRIDSVKKRDAGLKFEMSGLKLKFDYVARPIGGINSKAALLDILSNFMVMGSASAVFFGGAHRFRIAGTRFPAMNHNAIKKLYGNNINQGIKEMANTFTGALNSTYDGDSFLGLLAEVGKGIWADFLNLIGNPFGLSGEGTSNKSALTAIEGIKNAITQKMHTGMQYPYLMGMRALLIGEPVGEWHVTIGNPMNPIAMIGNLICTNIEVEFDEDAGLGPDDFPLGFSVTVTLDHGMPRDRDAIESMFNKGEGRIYELPSKFEGTADHQTAVDNETIGRAGEGERVANGYATTTSSIDGVQKSLPNSGNDSTTLKISRKINMNLNNLTNVGFNNDSNSLISRIPYHAGEEWITKRSLK